MIWVSWRQHRSQAIACLALLAALAVYAILLGSSMRSAFSHDGLAACLARSQGISCPAAISAFMNEFGSAVNIAFWAVLLIAPGLLGVLIGAPLIARELEYGTWRLAWSQTVPRTRWLAAKLALVTGGLVVLGAAMTAVITWYRAPMDRLTGHIGDWVLGQPAGQSGSQFVRILYQPADRFWHFQFIEAGLFLALTASPVTIPRTPASTA